MKLGGFQKQSLIDYPGKITATVFTIGCNFRCPYCHNKGLVLGGAEEMSEEDVFAYLEENKKLLDAVTITGGEPTLQKDLQEFIKKLKEKGFLVKLDTNGSNPRILKELLPDLDYIAMDVKSSLAFEKYNSSAGTKGKELLEKVKESIDIIKHSGVDHEFRTTVVPGLHTPEDIESICKYLGEERFALQQFRPGKTLDEKYSEIKPFGKEELEDMKGRCKKCMKEVSLRGV